MVLNRPPILKQLFEENGLEIPSEWKGSLARASQQFQEEKEASKTAVAAIEDATAAKVLAENPVAEIDIAEDEFEGSSAETVTEGGRRQRKTRKATKATKVTKVKTPFDYILAFRNVWAKHGQKRGV